MPVAAPEATYMVGATRNANMKAVWNGKVIAESDDIVTVEGNAYFPASAVKAEYLADSATTTVCGWKGLANYHSLTVDGKANPDAAWFYKEPNAAAAEIKGRVAFWKGVEVGA